jgi:molybdopterin converting factor small subunit
MDNQVTFRLIDCGLGGDPVDHHVATGTGLLPFLKEYLKNPEDIKNTLIRVNRQVVKNGYILKEGDVVSLTPAKVSGATTSTI